MLKDTNFTVSETSNLFVTSDLHKSHDKEFIYKPRGFNSVKDHDDWLTKSWNERVKPEDNVLFLGDFLVGAGRDSYKIGKDFLFSLKGAIFIIFGNHPAFMKQYYKESLIDFYISLGQSDSDAISLSETHEVYPLQDYTKKVTFLGDTAQGKVKTKDGTHYYFANHFPVNSWLDMSRGRISLSGHEHSNDPEWGIDELHKGKKLDAGVDNAKKHNGSCLFSWDEIIRIMNRKQYLSVGHH